MSCLCGRKTNVAFREARRRQLHVQLLCLSEQLREHGVCIVGHDGRPAPRRRSAPAPFRRPPIWTAATTSTWARAI